MNDKQLILFDGVCSFCNGAVNFIIKRDPESQFVFAPIQSVLGQAMMAQYNLQSEPDTFALIVEGRCYTMSNAALKVSSQLSGPWPLMQAFLIFPKRFRDFIYLTFGRNRYRWFGKLDQCVVPTADIRSRFVGDQDMVDQEA